MGTDPLTKSGPFVFYDQRILRYFSLCQLFSLLVTLLMFDGENIRLSADAEASSS